MEIGTAIVQGMGLVILAVKVVVVGLSVKLLLMKLKNEYCNDILLMSTKPRASYIARAFFKPSLAACTHMQRSKIHRPALP
jgi:hypothetical protein